MISTSNPCSSYRGRRIAALRVGCRRASLLLALAASVAPPSSLPFPSPSISQAAAFTPRVGLGLPRGAPRLDALETAHRGCGDGNGRMPCLSMVTSMPDIDPSFSSSSSSSPRADPSAPPSGSGSRRKKGGPKGRGSTFVGGAGSGSAPSSSNDKKRRRRKKYQRKKPKPETEKRQDRMRRLRQEKFERVRAREAPSIWSFEALFPEPVWDEATVKRDLYEVNERDGKTFLGRIRAMQAVEGDVSEVENLNSKGPFSPKLDAAVSGRMKKLQDAGISQGAPSKLKIWREKPSLDSSDASNDLPPGKSDSVSLRNAKDTRKPKVIDKFSWGSDARIKDLAMSGNTTTANDDKATVDSALTRMVENRLYGYRRTATGDYQYETSLMGDGAVQFRDGKRLGNALKVNADLLTFHAKKDMSHGRLEEAEEMYERVIEIDPRDGRAYLGLSRIAQRRRDFAYARECLRAGIANSFNPPIQGPGGALLVDKGPNPFLLQALGCLEERVGSLAEAEELYVAAARSRPSHAAAWVSLAQLRTRKLRQGAAAGRACYQTAERELSAAGLKPSAHVYTAWASMEYKKAGDTRKARELFERALECDPRCSAAWLQLGVMEADRENWSRAQECFEAVLKFDKRNSRVLQAYAIMESRRPDGDSREAIGRFEKALKAKPRDAGVLQAYALYVAKLGDVDAARDLLRRGTEVDKRHAAVWQAWGVLETRYGTPQAARDIFQQGIWACAQSGGGQSGGRRCARLWQAWGVLESREGDHAAARRCFSRALDADNRNVAAVTAWTQMEGQLGNFRDARSIFERILKKLPPSSDEKMVVWRAYELMEEKAGNQKAAQQVYNRYMRETISVGDDLIANNNVQATKQLQPPPELKSVLKTSSEVEVVRWRTSEVMGGEVWMNKGSIEGKVPSSTMKKKKGKMQRSDKKP